MSVLSQRETLHLEREQALIKWRQRATELNDARSDENCPELRAARAVIDQMSVDIARLDAEHETLLERSQLARALSGALDYWVREHAHGMHREYDGPKPELGPGETVLQAIDRCREKYLAIEGEFWQVQDSSWDAKKLAVREYVKALAAKSAPKVIGLIEGSRTIEWPRDKSPHSIGHGPVMSIPLVDPVALLAWFAPEQLIRRLEEEVAAAEDIRLSLKLDEIESAMLATQRVQEAFIRLAEASGETIDRWLNADPRAVLGLR